MSADLYFSGLEGSVTVEGGSGADLPAARSLGEVALDARGRANIDVEVAARGMAWFSFRRP